MLISPFIGSIVVPVILAVGLLCPRLEDALRQKPWLFNNHLDVLRPRRGDQIPDFGCLTIGGEP